VSLALEEHRARVRVQPAIGRAVGVAEVDVVVVEEFNELDGSRLLRNSRRGCWG
jgi:hypothetical protein